jgi:hypothetical protein
MHEGLSHVILGHLSQVNNRPEAALQCASMVVQKNGAESDVAVTVAPRKTIGEVLRI